MTGPHRLNSASISLADIPFSCSAWKFHPYNDQALATFGMNEAGQHAPYGIDYDQHFTPNDIPQVILMGQVFNPAVAYLSWIPASESIWDFINQRPVESPSQSGMFRFPDALAMVHHSKTLAQAASALGLFLSERYPTVKERCYDWPWLDYSTVMKSAEDLEFTVADKEELQSLRNAVFRACWRLLAWTICSRILVTMKYPDLENEMTRFLQKTTGDGGCTPMHKYLYDPVHTWCCPQREIGVLFTLEHSNDLVERLIHEGARCYEAIPKGCVEEVAKGGEERARNRPSARLDAISRKYRGDPPLPVSPAPLTLGVYSCNAPTDGREWYSSRWVVCKDYKEQWVVWKASSASPQPRWMLDRFLKWRKSSWTIEVVEEHPEYTVDQRVAEALRRQKEFDLEEIRYIEGSKLFGIAEQNLDRPWDRAGSDSSDFSAAHSTSPAATPTACPPSPTDRATNRPGAFYSRIHRPTLESPQLTHILPTTRCAFLPTPAAPAPPTLPSPINATRKGIPKEKSAVPNVKVARTVVTYRGDELKNRPDPFKGRRGATAGHASGPRISPAPIPGLPERARGYDSSAGNWRHQERDPKSHTYEHDQDRAPKFVGGRVWEWERHHRNLPPRQDRAQSYRAPPPPSSPSSQTPVPAVVHSTSLSRPPRTLPPRDISLHTPPPQPLPLAPPLAPVATPRSTAPDSSLRVMENLQEHGLIVTDGRARFVVPPGTNPLPRRVIKDRGTDIPVQPHPGVLVPRLVSAIANNAPPARPLPPPQPKPSSYVATFQARMHTANPRLQLRMNKNNTHSPLPAIARETSSGTEDEGPFPTARRFLEVLRTSLSPEGPLDPDQTEWWPGDMQGIPGDRLEFIIGQEVYDQPLDERVQTPHFIRLPMHFWVEAWHFSRHERWRRYLIKVVERYGRLYHEGGGCMPKAERHTALGHMRIHIRPGSSPTRALMRSAMDEWRMEITRTVGGRLLTTLLCPVPMPADDTIAAYSPTTADMPVP